MNSYDSADDVFSEDLDPGLASMAACASKLSVAKKVGKHAVAVLGSEPAPRVASGLKKAASGSKKTPSKKTPPKKSTSKPSPKKSCAGLVASHSMPPNSSHWSWHSWW